MRGALATDTLSAEAIRAYFAGGRMEACAFCENPPLKRT
jgi:hypothetical protein